MLELQKSFDASEPTRYVIFVPNIVKLNTGPCYVEKKGRALRYIRATESLST